MRASGQWSALAAAHSGPSGRAAAPDACYARIPGPDGNGAECRYLGTSFRRLFPAPGTSSYRWAYGSGTHITHVGLTIPVMTVEARDLEFLEDIATEFFAQRSIRRTLQVISDQSISGWEKWIQVEFATFIHDHDNVKAWSRETPYATDQRIEKARSRCAVDFIIHQKHKQSHLALEIKQVKSVSRCARAMVEDIVKMWTIRKSEFDIRSVWCLGIHQAAPEAEVLRKLNYHADELNVNLSPSLIVTKAIGRTGYSFSLI